MSTVQTPTQGTLKIWDGQPIGASLFLQNIAGHAASNNYINLLLRYCDV